jgi:hypothetical protein
LPDARAALADIGRRSPLIDWRLLLQAILAGIFGDADSVAANRTRIAPNAFASRIAAALFDVAGDPAAQPPACRKLADDARILPDVRRAAAVNPKSYPEGFELVAQTAIRLHAAGRIELALVFLCSYLNQLAGDAFNDALGTQMPSLFAADPKLMGRIDLRDSIFNTPLSDGDYADDAFNCILYRLSPPNRWSMHEKAILLLQACRYAKANSQADFSDPFDNKDDSDQPCGIHAIAPLSREVLSLWPELTEAYELWLWAEDQLGVVRSAAFEHWHKANPSDPNVLVRWISRLIRHDQFKFAMGPMEKLRKFPGEKRKWQSLGANMALHQLRNAILMGRPLSDRDLGVAPDDLPPVPAAALRLLQHVCSQSTRPIADTLQATVATLENPWIALFLAIEAFGNDLAEAHLAGPIRKRFDAPPDQLARQLLETIQCEFLSHELPVGAPILEPFLRKTLDPLQTADELCDVLAPILLAPAWYLSPLFGPIKNSALAAALVRFHAADIELADRGTLLLSLYCIRQIQLYDFMDSSSSDFLRYSIILFHAASTSPHSETPAHKKLRTQILNKSLAPPLPPPSVKPSKVELLRELLLTSTDAEEAFDHIRMAADRWYNLPGPNSFSGSKPKKKPKKKPQAKPKKETAQKPPKAPSAKDIFNKLLDELQLPLF